MLRYFHLENWKSFHEPTTLDLVATREQRDGETLAHVYPPKGRILPVAAIYGANAAGKSGLVEALAALQEIVTQDRVSKARLPVVSSRYGALSHPTRLEVEFVASSLGDENVANGTGRTVHDTTYRYTITVDQKQILTESLQHIRAASEQEVFFRDIDGAVELYGELNDDSDARAFATTVEKNETLLRRLAMRKQSGADHISMAYNWFYSQLTVVVPDSMAVRVPLRLRADQLYRGAMAKDLSEADTGISEIAFRDVSTHLAGLSDAEVAHIEDSLSDGDGQLLIRTPEDRLLIVEMRNGKLAFEEMVTRHACDQGIFELSLDQESDGTVRYFHLLPALHELVDPEAAPVYVIDELDRSLHSALTEQLIRRFLEKSTNDSRAQLIFTTHDPSLIRRDLLRRDEIWFVGKETTEGTESRSSELVRLSDLSSWGIRDSTDVFNLFLAGALPGSPRLA